MFKHFFWEYNKQLRPEFFPGWFCYISVRIYWFLKWITWSHPLWFTRTNPWFPLWWLYPSGKWEILEQLPDQYVPKTVFIKEDDFTVKKISVLLKENNLWFPMIVKPDNWLRGLWIEIFHTEKDFKIGLPAYIEENKRRWSWLFQEFISYPLELWIFYIRKPSNEKGMLTWIVEKEFLFIQGDWISTLQQLVHLHPRAKYHFKLLQEKLQSQWQTVLEEGVRLEVVEIWTHSMWSTFLDRSEYVTPELSVLIDSLAKQIKWFHYWRFDIRAESLETLLQWKFKVMEVNPTYGEPTWMYDPDYSFLEQQKILLKHRFLMFEVAEENRNMWVEVATIKQWKKAKKIFNSMI